MKLRSVWELNEWILRTLSWRKKELTHLRFMIELARASPEERMMICAGLALLYAHWEGFVKEAGTAYVNFVSRQALRYSDLTANFIAIATKARLDTLASTQKMAAYCEVTEFFVNGMEQPARIPWRNSIRTGANLNSGVLRNITTILGVDHAPFATKEKPVIDRLVQARNLIAHGQMRPVDGTEYTTLHIEVVGLLETLANQIVAAAQTGAFRR